MTHSLSDDRFFNDNAPAPVASADEWHAVLDLALSRMQCDTGTIHRLEPGSRTLKLVASRGIPDELLPKVGAIPIGKGIAGAAAERRQPVQICNLQTDETAELETIGAWLAKAFRVSFQV